MKKLFVCILSIAMLLALSACGSKVVHCDGCGKEIKVGIKENVDEDWIVYCDECGDPAADLIG